MTHQVTLYFRAVAVFVLLSYCNFFGRANRKKKTIYTLKAESTMSKSQMKGLI